ncbi:MAG: hypothetical protein M1829_001985 [Trizodia sp. TS-e1964]|nr:MAG: hypothetical protein M1829_001985 [Trizodia sp. TS-e1964]
MEKQMQIAIVGSRSQYGRLAYFLKEEFEKLQTEAKEKNAILYVALNSYEGEHIEVAVPVSLRHSAVPEVTRRVYLMGAGSDTFKENAAHAFNYNEELEFCYQNIAAESSAVKPDIIWTLMGPKFRRYHLFEKVVASLVLLFAIWSGPRHKEYLEGLHDKTPDEVVQSKESAILLPGEALALLQILFETIGGPTDNRLHQYLPKKPPRACLKTYALPPASHLVDPEDYSENIESVASQLSGSKCVNGMQRDEIKELNTRLMNRLHDYIRKPDLSSRFGALEHRLNFDNYALYRMFCVRQNEVIPELQLPQHNLHLLLVFASSHSSHSSLIDTLKDWTKSAHCKEFITQLHEDITTELSLEVECLTLATLNSSKETDTQATEDTSAKLLKDSTERILKAANLLETVVENLAYLASS